MSSSHINSSWKVMVTNTGLLERCYIRTQTVVPNYNNVSSDPAFLEDWVNQPSPAGWGWLSLRKVTKIEVFTDFQTAQWGFMCHLQNEILESPLLSGVQHLTIH